MRVCFSLNWHNNPTIMPATLSVVCLKYPGRFAWRYHPISTPHFSRTRTCSTSLSVSQEALYGSSILWDPAVGRKEI